MLQPWGRFCKIYIRVQGTTTTLHPKSSRSCHTTASLQAQKVHHIWVPFQVQWDPRLSHISISVAGLSRSQRLVWMCCLWCPTWPPSSGTLPHASRRSWSFPPGRCSPWSRRGSPPCRSEGQRRHRLSHKLIRFTYIRTCICQYIQFKFSTVWKCLINHKLTLDKCSVVLWPSVAQISVCIVLTAPLPVSHMPADRGPRPAPSPHYWLGSVPLRVSSQQCLVWVPLH